MFKFSSSLEGFRRFQAEIEADDNVLSISFFPGESAEVPLERLAVAALILLKGTGHGEDISDLIL